MIIVSGLEPKQYKITTEGVEELRRQLERLRHKRMEVADEIREITSQSTELGSLVDSTRAMNHNQAIEIDGEITLLERIIAMAHPITRPASNEKVEVGSRVCIDLNGKEHCYLIVGALEADPAEDKISDESPLGRSLVGKRVGDKVEIVSPAKQHITATVIRID